MRIGLLPTIGVSCGHSNTSPGAVAPRPRVIALSPTFLSVTDASESAIYGSSHVDLDH